MKWIDLHCDTLSILTGGADTGIERCRAGLRENNLCVDARRLKEAGAAAQFFACYVNASDFCNGEVRRNGEIWDRAYRKILSMTAYAACAQDERFRIARSAEDIMNMESAAQTAGILTVEEGGVLNGRPERLDKLYDSGVRLITLTWNYENCIGSPNSREPGMMQRGLTPFGIQTVEKMNEKGMIVDVSHLSDGGFWDCIRYSTKPILASHSNARALCLHPRNLSDEMLHAIGEKGGAAGVNFYGAFLRPDGRADVTDIVRHIRYMMDRAGEDAVALGTDFDGFDRDSLPAGISGVQDMGVLWDAMKRSGIAERQIEKAAYGNVMRVLRECVG